MRQNRTYNPGNKHRAVDKNTKCTSYDPDDCQWFSSVSLGRLIDLIQPDDSKYQCCDSWYWSETETHEQPNYSQNHRRGSQTVLLLSSRINSWRRRWLPCRGRRRYRLRDPGTWSVRIWRPPCWLLRHRWRIRRSLTSSLGLVAGIDQDRTVI